MSTATHEGNGRPPVPAEAEAFVNALFLPDDVVVIRPIETWTEDGDKQSKVIYRHIRHYPAQKLLNADIWNAVNARAKITRANPFFGVCSRFRADAQDGYDLAWQIRIVRALWSDADHCTWEGAVARVLEAGLPRPSIIVGSGHGAHLYWLLEEPCRIDDAGDPLRVFKEFVDQGEGKKKLCKQYVKIGENRVYEKLGDGRRNPEFPTLSRKARHVQAVIAGLGDQFGGDHTHDLARLLRLPGTLNRKEERNGVEPVPCVLIECEPSRRYPFADFEKFAAAPRAEPAQDKPAARSVPPSPFRVGGRGRRRLSRLIDRCATAADRSKAEFAACCEAIRQGIDKEEIWQRLQGVGKVAERGREYFDRTWETAEAEVQNGQPPGSPGAGAAGGGGSSSGEGDTFSIGPLTLRPHGPRRTPAGKVTLGVRVERGAELLDEITLNNSASGRKQAAEQIGRHLEGEAPLLEKVEGAVNALIVWAVNALEDPPEDQHSAVLEIVRRKVPEILQLRYRTDAGGLWSETRRAELKRAEFLSYTPGWLLEEIARASPETQGVDSLAFLPAVKAALEVVWPEQVERLPVAPDVDLGPDSAAAQRFRADLVKLWKITRTWEVASDPKDPTSRTNLISRARTHFRKPRANGRSRWEEILKSLDAWWRPHVAEDGEVRLLLGMRYELTYQVQVDLAGVHNQESLTSLGRKFGVIDPDPPVSTIRNGRQRLAVLSRELTLELLEDPSGWEEDQEVSMTPEGGCHRDFNDTPPGASSESNGFVLEPFSTT